MKRTIGWPLFLAAVAASCSMLAGCRDAKNDLLIVTPKSASPLETLAAREIRRYLYLRTGSLFPIEESARLKVGRRPTVAVFAKGRLELPERTDPEIIANIDRLGDEEYLLKTIPGDSSNLVLVAGGDGPGILYGAYRFVESLGVRFYLHGDVVPDKRLPASLPDVDELGKPLFRLRGIHPFHDFPEGPDWWSREDYLAVIAQLPKLRMNFFGLHTYPEGRPNAEPTVWIGQPGDAGENGLPEFSYPSSYQNTLRGNWGYEPAKTSGFHYGAAELFDRDDYGAEVMTGFAPEPKTPADMNELFRRTGNLLRDAFSFGRGLGVKSCVGTEMPLTIPDPVKKRLIEQGKDPGDPGTVAELYRGMFERIKTTYPLDYYWLWTDENWTWSDASEAQVEAVIGDARTAIAAAAEAGAPFSMATCGWVLGPPSDRTLFDRELPKNLAVSCINREVGKAPVDPVFGRIGDRSKWAIPWIEDDPALTSPQLWAGRMRKDAMDALTYGCDGLLGIHWRTRVLGPTVSALARAAWNQKPWAQPAFASAQAEGPINGVFASAAGSPVSGEAARAVYLDYRDRVYGYRLAVPNGRYRVDLQFIEGEMKEKGRRVFDVSLQGKRVIEKLDIFARAGMLRPLELRFADIEVTDGTLSLDFADRIHYPAIAGIMVRGQDFARKINCGGPRLEDYEPDWPETTRFAPIDDFYADWAASEFGEEAGPMAAAVFARIDGRLPQVSVWANGPGGLKPDPRPWEEAAKDFGFVAELAALQPRVTGDGNKERFAYWLSTFLYMRETARLECLWGEYDRAVAALRKPEKAASKISLAESTLVPIRERLVACLESIYGHLLATVSNPGELGTVANWEQHLIPGIILKPNEELRTLMGRELPSAAQPSRGYQGRPRIIVPAARTLLAEGEALTLRVIILAGEPASEASLYWRPLGAGEYQAVDLKKRDRGVYEVTCPETGRDIEYYVRIRAGEDVVVYPATAPAINQTVVRKPS